MWDDGFIETAGTLAGYVFHLRTMAAVVEHDDIALLRLGAQIFKGFNAARVRRSFIGQDLNILGSEIKLADQKSLHILYIIHSTGKGRYDVWITISVYPHE